MAVKAIPEGYHSVTPYVVVDGAAKFIDFAKRAFGAKELYRMAMPNGSIMHAELQIGDSRLMLGQASKECKPIPCMLYYYVTDADAVYKNALKAGATSTMAPADQFYGDRSGAIKDPFGNQWWIATHKEDVPPEELRRRAEEQFKQPIA